MIRLSQRIKVVLLLITGLTCLGIPGWTQSAYRYKADLQKIDTSGVYKIKINPDFVAKCNDNLSDIRLSDQGKFLGYVLSTNAFINNPEHFIEFQEVRGNYGDTTEIYVAENKDGMYINNLSIRFKNADVDRTISLSGSDNLKKWYAIKENYFLEKPEPGN